ncbi:predicted protein [Arabidopsis lyrata subsp. lyrata]|uniref:Predicted protein n=1 Tax=Arabidopsis lyrata subsp. lyrata TaxID=81972 RepID=D7KP93_ARALL|nr:predicted protein [Arabidopsis lyrata subsp. lyrata]
MKKSIFLVMELRNLSLVNGPGLLLIKSLNILILILLLYSSSSISVSQAVDFKKPVYKEVMSAFASHLQ